MVASVCAVDDDGLPPGSTLVWLGSVSVVGGGLCMALCPSDTYKLQKNLNVTFAWARISRFPLATITCNSRTKENNSPERWRRGLESTPFPRKLPSRPRYPERNGQYQFSPDTTDITNTMCSHRHQMSESTSSFTDIEVGILEPA